VTNAIVKIAPAQLAAHRATVESRLADAFANDIVDVDDFEQRMQRAQHCVSLAELDELVTDLPAVTASLANKTADNSLVVASSSSANLRTLLASNERRGAWTAAATMRVRTTLGSTVLDFRDAVLTAAVTEIRLRVVLGNVEIIVPPNFLVDVDVSAMLGSANGGGSTQTTQGAPRLRIVGRVLLGSLEVNVMPRNNETLPP
jgi:hypothetical protein